MLFPGLIKSGMTFYPSLLHPASCLEQVHYSMRIAILRTQILRQWTEVNMKGEPVHSDKKSDRAGPQGTQVFSRDQIADILDESPAPDSQRELASLVLLTNHADGSESGTAFRLSSDRLTIGRSSVCDLSIEEPSMSSEHARLVFSDEAWRVVNLLSTNGVFVNDEKVFSHRLHDGDEIRLGRVRLRFRESAGGSGGHGSNISSVMKWAPWVAVAMVIAGGAAIWMLK